MTPFGLWRRPQKMKTLMTDRSQALTATMQHIPLAVLSCCLSWARKISLQSKNKTDKQTNPLAPAPPKAPAFLFSRSQVSCTYWKKWHLSYQLRLKKKNRCQRKSIFNDLERKMEPLYRAYKGQKQKLRLFCRPKLHFTNKLRTTIRYPKYNLNFTRWKYHYLFT